ncbi:MAG: hypothetical protein A2X32_02725 [Elusimicrobia bacterium GWC2_64_44]|nr:MAG: hypothetical protein A2X32_02725 [Elusimicrobia bacterium GWC2_64_44]
MKRKLINSLLLLALAAQAHAAAPAKRAAAQKAAPKAAPAAEAPKASPWDLAPSHNIRTGEIVVYTPVTGISTAQETYDIFAPFDGRVEEVQTEMFAFVTPKHILARMVSTEMAALLDSSSEESRKQTERRWQDVYSFTEVKPETEGVVTNVYIEPRTRVNKGDRLFTVAKKVVIIGKNTETLYSKLAPGMTAKVKHLRTEAEFDTTLVNFLRVKNSQGLNRLWLEVTDLKNGVKIGEQFDGQLFIGKSSNAMLVPRGHIIDAGGRRFLVTEITTGLETAEETEILGHSSLYLEPPFTAARSPEAKDGKSKKDR